MAVIESEYAMFSPDVNKVVPYFSILALGPYFLSVDVWPVRPFGPISSIWSLAALAKNSFLVKGGNGACFSRKSIAS